MDDERRDPEPNAGAFMGPDIMVPVPMEPLGSLPKAPDEDDPGTDQTADEERPGFATRIKRRITGEAVDPE